MTSFQYWRQTQANSDTVKGRSIPVIGFLDVDSFECQLYQRDEPQFRGQPCVVATSSGRIVAVTSEAKAFGINRNATPRVKEAKKLCPNLKVFKKPNYYGKQDSRKTRHSTWELLDSVKEFCTEHGKDIVVELASSDEIYLDLSLEISRGIEAMMKKRLEAWPSSTFFPIQLSQNVVFEAKYKKFFGPLIYNVPFKNGPKLFPETYMKEEEARIYFGGFFMQTLQEHILEKIQLTCSCGVATNKLLAKVACEVNKPGKVTVLPECSLRKVSSFFPIENIPGLKTKTGQNLMDAFNINNMYQITQVNFEELEKVFGYDLAQKISSWGEGRDNEPVVPKEMNDKITLNMPEHARINNWSTLLREIKNLNDEMDERLNDEKYRHHRTAHQIRVEVTFIMKGNETDKQCLDIDLDSPLKRFKYQDVSQQVLEFIKKWEYFKVESFSITKMSFTAKDFQRINENVNNKFERRANNPSFSSRPFIPSYCIPVSSNPHTPIEDGNKVYRLSVHTKTINTMILQNFKKMKQVGAFQTTSHENFNVSNNYPQLLPEYKLQKLIGARLNHTNDSDARPHCLISDHTQYNEFKHHCFIQWLKSNYQHAMKDAKNRPDFVASQGRIMASVLSPVCARISAWEVYGINVGGSIYLWDEKSPSIESRAAFVGAYFDQLVCAEEEELCIVNEYKKSYVMNEAMLGKYKVLLLNHIDAQHEDGGFVQVNLGQCDKKMSRNVDFKTFRQKKIWAQLVLSGSKHLTLGISKCGCIKEITTFGTEEYIEKFFQQSQVDSDRCFTFQESLFGLMKTALPKSDPKRVVKFSWVPGKGEVIGIVEPEQRISELIVPRLYSSFFQDILS